MQNSYLSLQISDRRNPVEATSLLIFQLDVSLVTTLTSRHLATA